MAMGVWAACSGLGVAVGPVVGGWILRHFDWGAIFLINVPLVAAIAAGAWLSIDESTESERGSIDAPGNLLAIAGLLGFVWSVIEAPERGWTSPWVLAGLGASAVLCALFVRREARASHPMLDLKLIGSRDCAIACLAIGAAFFGLFGFVFMVTQFLQFVRGHDALEAGVRTLPFAGSIVVGAAAVARLGRSVEPRWLAASGLALMSAGFAWALVDRVDTPYAVLAGQMCALGVGLGLVEHLRNGSGHGRAGFGSAWSRLVAQRHGPRARRDAWSRGHGKRVQRGLPERRARILRGFAASRGCAGRGAAVAWRRA
jgi:MFS family permease